MVTHFRLWVATWEFSRRAENNKMSINRGI